MTINVWITRTEPGASRLAVKLRNVGYSPLVAPIFDIVPVSTSVPSVQPDVWVFVSVHAVNHASRYAWDQTIPVVVVGPATAAALKPFGVDPLIPSHQSSEGMYNLIRTCLAPERPVTVVAGRDGRKDLIRWLDSDGYRCSEWIVYERKATDFQIGATHVDAIVVNSAVALASIREQYSSLKNVSIPLVVPSHRYAELAESLRFENVITAENASDEATLNTLKKIFGR